MAGGVADRARARQLRLVADWLEHRAVDLLDPGDWHLDKLLEDAAAELRRRAAELEAGA